MAGDVGKVYYMLLVIKKYFSMVDTFCNSFGCHLVYQLLNITSKN